MISSGSANFRVEEGHVYTSFHMQVLVTKEIRRQRNPKMLDGRSFKFVPNQAYETVDVYIDHRAEPSEVASFLLKKPVVYGQRNGHSVTYTYLSRAEGDTYEILCSRGT